jgi:hypothetical protein
MDYTYNILYDPVKHYAEFIVVDDVKSHLQFVVVLYRCLAVSCRKGLRSSKTRWKVELAK